MIYRSMDIVTASHGEEISIDISHGFFVALFRPAHPAVGLYCEGNPLHPEGMKKLLREAGSSLGGFDTVSAKLMGDPALIREFVRVLESSQIAIEKIVPRKSPFTVIFHPATGRIQLSRAPTETETVHRVRVLVVDDSRRDQEILCDVLKASGQIDTYATGSKPSEVEDCIAVFRPDVITLDVMTVGGIPLLREIVRRHRIPTVVVSPPGFEASNAALDSFEAGAVDYLPKPARNELAATKGLLIEKVLGAVSANVRTGNIFDANGETITSITSDALDSERVIAIGASTGGTEALRFLLTRLPSQIPPILIVQHIPAEFSRPFAERLNQLCPFDVKEAENGDSVVANRVLIAPGGYQMWVQSLPSGLTVRTSATDPAVNRHKPSVDVLFQSCADQIGASCIGVILTGMGNDGAKGLLQIRQAGGETIAQDRASSIVFGMPRQAIALGAADSVVSLQEIPEKLLQILGTPKKAAA